MKKVRIVIDILVVIFVVLFLLSLLYFMNGLLEIMEVTICRQSLYF